MKILKNIKAAMFDFDGTVTEKGKYEPPFQVANALVRLSEKMPIGFCTGRQLESFERHGLSELLKEIDPGKKPAFLKNLFVFAENGAIGYCFDEKTQNFEEFYRVEWPEEFVSRDEFKKTLSEAIEDYGQVYDNAHKVAVVMRTKLHDTIERDVLEVYKLSDKIYEICLSLLRKISPDFENFVHVGNSGIGVIICPADGDKDSAIKRFAEYLVKIRNFDFCLNYREILVVGDSPQTGGNDHYFLAGKLGTAYNVGEKEVENKFLQRVTDPDGKILLNSKGSLCLIEYLLKGLLNC